jgi:hypothetical protein
MPSSVANAALWSEDDNLFARKIWPEVAVLHNLSWIRTKLTHIDLTFEQFVWGYSMLLSRSFKDVLGRAALTPIADLFNHNFKPNVRASVDRRSILSVKKDVCVFCCFVTF